jgi:hypothetical protein
LHTVDIVAFGLAFTFTVAWLARMDAGSSHPRPVRRDRQTPIGS